MHRWAITKTKDPQWRKCAKCGMIRIKVWNEHKAWWDAYYKRGNRYVYGDDPWGQSTPKCVS